MCVCVVHTYNPLELHVGHWIVDTLAQTGMKFFIGLFIPAVVQGRPVQPILRCLWQDDLFFYFVVLTSQLPALLPPAVLAHLTVDYAFTIPLSHPFILNQIQKFIFFFLEPWPF